MMWARVKRDKGRWRIWFALLPTIVYEDDHLRIYVWLKTYEWKREGYAKILRRPRNYAKLDPYEVPAPEESYI